MMDWSVVNVPIQQRASMRGSVFVRSQQEMFDDKARSESEYAAAWLRHKQIIDHGRHWGTCVPPPCCLFSPACSCQQGHCLRSSQSTPHHHPCFTLRCMHVQYACSSVHACAPREYGQDTHLTQRSGGAGWRIGAKSLERAADMEHGGSWRRFWPSSVSCGRSQCRLIV